jgi:hypothetical protein
MLIAWTVGVKSEPEIPSRSRSKNLGARSQGNASRTCWHVHAVVGCKDRLDVLSQANLCTSQVRRVDRIDVEENCRRARFFARLRVEDRGGTERELARVHMLRMLVQQESEIGGR